MTTPADLRFFTRSKLVLAGYDTPCWLWMGAKTNGYGQMWITDRSRKTHRVAYELLVGPIPEGLTLDHLCRNRACGNPDHLEPVTLRENILRGTGPWARMAAQTHCVHGHAFDDENTIHRARGHRGCRACQRAAQRRYYWLKKATASDALHDAHENGRIEYDTESARIP